MKKLFLHTRFERVWHWTNAALFLLLILTGIQLHWPDKFILFNNFSYTVVVHNWAGIFLCLIFLTWFFHGLLTRRLFQYIPKKEDFHPGLIVQTKYYLYGIFRDDPHPYTPLENNKFNPLQKMAYCFTMLLQMPLLLISGVLYLYPDCSPLIMKIGGLKTIAVFHFIIAVTFVCFLGIHLYLSTTGETFFSSIVTMITGYEEQKEH